MDDVRVITDTIRPADRQECEALTGLPPALVLPSQLTPGRRVVTFTAPNGDILGMGGDDPSMVPGLGIIWFVGTTAVEANQVHFLRAGAKHVNDLFDRYTVIGNLVDARNTKHIRWLRWLGFSFLRKEEKWGAHSVPFIEFAKAKPLSCVSS